MQIYIVINCLSRFIMGNQKKYPTHFTPPQLMKKILLHRLLILHLEFTLAFDFEWAIVPQIFLQPELLGRFILDLLGKNVEYHFQH